MLSIISNVMHFPLQSFIDQCLLKRLPSRNEIKSNELEVDVFIELLWLEIQTKNVRNLKTLLIVMFQFWKVFGVALLLGHVDVIYPTHGLSHAYDSVLVYLLFDDAFVICW